MSSQGSYAARLSRVGRLSMRRRAFKIESKRAARRAASGDRAGGMARAMALAQVLPTPMYGARGIQYNVHRFLRWRDTRAEPDGVGPLLVSCNMSAAGVGPANVQSFLFNQISHHSELANLYDQYRLDKVELWFDYTPDVYTFTSTDTAVATGQYFPKLWIRRDYDGQDPTTLSLDLFEQSNQSQCLRFGPGRTTIGPYYITPAIANTVFTAAAGGTVSAGCLWRQWLDTASAGSRAVPHFGVSMLAQGLPSANLGAITVRVRYHVSMKNVR